MTTMPQPNAPGSSFTATYDAWNRLIGLKSSGTDVAGYRYDGAKRRIIQQTYTAGILSETRHFYYTEPSSWQVIEERTGTSPNTASMDRQFVWGLQYIDDIVIRDRTSERLYALQDGNWNVVSLADTSGIVQERYVYPAYGTPKCLTPGFGDRSSSSYEWELLYCGYRWESTNALYHVRNRGYNLAVGTWLQRDPLGYTNGVNLYENTFTINMTDPFGTTSQPCAVPWQCIAATTAFSVAATFCILCIAGAPIMPAPCIVPCCSALALLSQILRWCPQRPLNRAEQIFANIISTFALICLTIGLGRPFFPRQPPPRPVPPPQPTPVPPSPPMPPPLA